MLKVKRRSQAAVEELVRTVEYKGIWIKRDVNPELKRKREETEK